jgi:hypothetical protein
MPVNAIISVLMMVLLWEQGIIFVYELRTNLAVLSTMIETL